MVISKVRDGRVRPRWQEGDRYGKRAKFGNSQKILKEKKLLLLLFEKSMLGAPG